MALLSDHAARDAYEALAEHYDLLTHHYRHDVWLSRLEALALAHGLAGRRVLDVACGTGKSFMPLVARGYEVTACDISPEMLARARRAAPPEVTVLAADMRALPALGPFDLVTCLDDALNYLLTEEELHAAIRGFASVLAPGGLAVFDTNTLATYRSSYRSAWVVEDDDAFLCWRGHGVDERGDGVTASATVEVFAREREGLWRRASSVHRQRHWPGCAVHDAVRASGLTCVAVRAQRVGAVLECDVDEQSHTKTVYVARRPTSAASDPSPKEVSR
jgi:SAM-dependent methyltransferase